MTYIVSGGALNSTNSIRANQELIFYYKSKVTGKGNMNFVDSFYIDSF